MSGAAAALRIRSTAKGPSSASSSTRKHGGTHVRPDARAHMCARRCVTVSAARIARTARVDFLKRFLDGTRKQLCSRNAQFNTYLPLAPITGAGEALKKANAQGEKCNETTQ